MNILIGQIVTIIVEFIKTWFNKLKIKTLTSELDKAREKSSESTKETTDAYTAFMRDYDVFMAEWEEKSGRRMSDALDDLPEPSSKATSNNSRPSTNNRKTRPANNGTKKPVKGSKGKRKKR